MPPGPLDSSHDLLIGMIKEIIDERTRDYRDGLSLRALNQRLTEHAAFDEKRHGELETRIRDLEQKAAKQEGQIDTGRFLLPPPGQLPVVTINAGGRSKRPSHPILSGLIENPKAVMTLIALVTVLAHAILRLLR
jgi:hypothetical protein